MKMTFPILPSFIFFIALATRISFAQTPDWVATQNHDSSSSNVPVRLIADGSGNITALNGFYAGNPYANLLKYNSSGSLISLFYLDSIHVPWDMTSDASGNYYVVGAGSIVFNQLLTVQKINSAGALQWTYRDSHDVGLDVDIAAAINRDASGNIYIAGYWYDGVNPDVLTIKLNSSGVEQWRKLYDLSGLGDYGKAISIDGSGNVYVTGYGLSAADNFHQVMLTIKYNSSGTLQWAKTYAGAVPGYDDKANDIVTDASGNSFVTGYAVEADTLRNIVTIKYNTSGTIIWKKKYAGKGLGEGKKIFLDGSGNVYVAGENLEHAHADSLDLTTVKYSAGGSQLYINHFDHGKNFNDHCVSAWLDASSNLYVGGYSNDTTTGNYSNHVEVAVKYSNGGSKVWSAVFSTNSSYDVHNYAITSDASGIAFTAGSAFKASTGISNTYITSRSAVGTLLWSAQYNGPSHNFESHTDLVVDNNGNSYSLGQKAQSAHVTIIVDKRDVNGNLLSTFSYSGVGNDLTPQRIAIDAQNNIYVCGYGYYSSGDQIDMLLIKFNKNGVLMWDKWLDASGGGNDYARSIAVDASSNIYTTGFGNKTGQGNNIYTSKYNKSGAKLWTKSYNDPGNSDDFGESVAADNSGNVFVTGYQLDPNNFGYIDLVTIKYNGTGTQQWATVSGTGNSADDDGKYVVADNSGGCYVTGRLVQTGQNSSFFVQRYASGGSVSWTRFRQVSSGFGPYEYGGRLLLDKSSNVYALGYVVKSGFDGTTLSVYKYKSNGDTLWTSEKLSGNNYLLSGNYIFGVDQVYPQQMALDSIGNLYLANVKSTTFDVQIQKLNKNGKVKWTYLNDIPAGSVVPLPNLAINLSGRVWCLFNVYTDFYSGEDWRTIEFPSGVGVRVASENEIEDDFEFSENNFHVNIYPDPVSDYFQIDLTDLLPGDLYIRVTNVNGQRLFEMKETVFTSLHEQISAAGWTSGIYLVEMFNDGRCNTQMMVKE